MTAEDEAAYERAILSKLILRVIPYLAILYLVAFVDRINIGIAALTMRADLGLSASAFGTGAGIFFIGYGLFEVPSNVMLAKVGPRLWISRILITWGLISMAMMLTRGETSFYILRFMLGVAEAGFFPGVIFYLSQWFPAAHRGKIIASFMVALPLSTTIGAPLSSLFLGLKYFGLHGWQWLFVVEGFITVLFGISVLWVLTDRPRDAKFLSDSEKAWLEAKLRAEEAAIPQDGHKQTLWGAFRSPRVWLLALMYFGMVSGAYALTFWLPQMVKALGVSNTQTGMLLAIPYLMAACVMLFWGRHSDKARERVWHLTLPVAVCSLSILLAGLTHSPLLAVIAMCVAVVGHYCSQTVFWTLPSAFLSGTASAAGIALVNSLGNLGGYAGPALIGYTKDYFGTYQSGLLSLGILWGVAAAIGFYVARQVRNAQALSRTK